MPYLGNGLSKFTTADDLTVSGDADIDGTTNLDVVDIDGAVDMASTLQVDGAITSSAGATISSSSSGEFNALTISQANNTSGNESRIRFKRTTDAGSDREVAAIVADRVGGNDTALVFETNTDGSDGAVERVRIDQDGVMLIGTTSTDTGTAGLRLFGNFSFAAFTDDGGNPLQLNRLSDDGSIIDLRKDGTTIGTIGVDGGDNLFITGQTGNTGGLYFNDAAVSPAYQGVERGDYYDLGKSAARFKNLWLSGNVNASGYVYAAGIAGSSDGNTYVNFPGSDVIQFFTNGSERARFDASGNFFIAKTSDTGTGTGISLGAGGFIRCVRSEITGVFNRLNDGTNLLFQHNSGAVGSISVTSSGTTFNTTSDIRLKQDIEPLEVTDKLMAMNPVSYNWKSDPDGPRSMGFIAQEMEEVMPEAVSTGDDDIMSMDYGRITPILVSALQDAHRKIEQLEQRIAEMETGNE